MAATIVNFKIPDAQGRVWQHQASISFDDKFYYIGFPFNKVLLDEIRSMHGARWLGNEEPPRKVWRISRNKRNDFQLAFLMGRPVYDRFKTPLPALLPEQIERYPALKPHQQEGCSQIIHRRTACLGWEMGVGKTYMTIAANGLLGIKNWLWIAPKSALNSVKLEMEKWGVTHPPQFMTYQGLTAAANKNEGPFVYVPEMVVFDESQRIKNPTTQQGQAAYDLCDLMREKYKPPTIVLLSGSPAPRSPLDWWHQTEVACPGYLKEGSHKAMTKRLAWTELKDGIRGAKFDSIKSWKDDENKCDVCAEFHTKAPEFYDHTFKKSKNEVAYLYKRMSGLVSVRFKKDVLDLPPQTRETRVLVPTQDLLRKAALVKKTSRRGVDALTRLRELSDGFIYKETETSDKIECEFCKGSGKPNQELMPGAEICDACQGQGFNFAMIRTAVKATSCPKWSAVADILDEHSDIGRLVIYAGFEGSVDICCELATTNGWDYIRVDGRGWKSTIPDIPDLEMLRLFQQPIDSPFKVGGIDRLVFIGHPGSAGTGLTLTASPTILYYSNSFNAEDRIQSEARNHRLGSIGSNIIDLINLPTDQYVLDNIKKKRDLQSLTMGDLSGVLEQYVEC